MMALLNSNFAAVGTQKQWSEAVDSGSALERSNLIESALQGAKDASAKPGLLAHLTFACERSRQLERRYR
ncbi:hypothetical protein CAT723_23110 [Corynebacterium ammoniagenes]|uniref:Uncharacterized protein n=1 Tax=Corynebacterium ammoniagenes TaxID=1697 RepID=A0AAV5G900_CORAM|nr:hypothetical protein CAT723_23110 [Corynebacterium ammoniagenes]